MKKILIFTILISLIILSACNELKVYLGDNSCELKASELIPEKVLLSKVNESIDTWVHESFTWKDETEVENIKLINYKSGSEKGENINYYYTNSKVHLTYTKQSLNKEGVILGDNSFAVEFVLKPTEETIPLETEIRVGTEVTTKKGTYFEIIEKRFDECKWYE